MKNKVWKKLTVFVSSTFQDMDAERDTLKYIVQPRLNQHYRKNKIEIQFVDLRIGINTEGVDEETAENRVLDICLYNIDESRPYFICLLGHKYGWIPDEKKWKSLMNRLAIEKRNLIVDGKNKSVTELEILYGAIGQNGTFLDHSLFFYRTPESYDNIPEDIKTIYCPEDKAGTIFHNISSLKSRINNLVKKRNFEAVTTPYTLVWNTDINKFDCLDSFAELVYQQMCALIDKEISENDNEQNWLEEEKLNNSFLIHQHTKKKYPLPIFDKVKSYIGKGGKHICITAQAVYGKSVLLAQLHEWIASFKNNVCLLAFVGATPYSMDMKRIMVRWICELKLYNKEYTYSRDWDDISFKELQQEFLIVCDKLFDKGLSIWVLIDGLDCLSTYSKDTYLGWLDSKFNLIATCSPEAVKTITFYHPLTKVFELKIPTKIDRINLIRKFEQEYNLELPYKIKDDIIRYNNCTPLRISLLMTLFCNLTQKNFYDIRKEPGDSEIDKINNYLFNLYFSAPKDDNKLFLFIIDKIIEHFSLPIYYRKIINYIAKSRIGLREEDIEALVGDNWRPIDLRTLIYVLKEYIYENPFNHRWYFKEPFYNDILISEDDDIVEDTAKLFTLINGYPEEDDQRKQMYAYYAIIGEKAAESKQVLASMWTTSFFKEVYNNSLLYLINDRHLYYHLTKYASFLSDNETIAFVHGLVEAFEFSEHPDICIILIDDLLFEISSDSLDDIASFKLGWNLQRVHMSFANQWNYLGFEVKYKHERKCYIEKAITAYKQCYFLNPQFGDCRNMLKAAMLDNLENIMDSGDWSKVEEYYKEINQL